MNQSSRSLTKGPLIGNLNPTTISNDLHLLKHNHLFLLVVLRDSDVPNQHSQPYLTRICNGSVHFKHELIDSINIKQELTLNRCYSSNPSRNKVYSATICQWNVNSISQNKMKLQVFHVNSEIDIFHISKTHLTDKWNFIIPDYECYDTEFRNSHETSHKALTQSHPSSKIS